MSYKFHKKAKKHNVAVDFNFIEFKAAFDNLRREALWKMLRDISVSGKIIKNLHRNTKCTITINEKLTEWLYALVGVRQRCLLYPTLLKKFLEFRMQEIPSMSDEFELTDKNLTMSFKFADDTTLISMHFKSYNFQQHDAWNKWRMKTNTD